MQQQQPAARPPRVQVLATRRKWGDWSVCSENCIRTRHRQNCDDLLATSGQNSTKFEDSKIKINTHLQLLNGKTLATGQATSALTTNSNFNVKRNALSSASETTRDNLLPNTSDLAQADEDDYADEGDEEDEDDSCANVDASKTIEEQPCVGGLCTFGGGVGGDLTSLSAGSGANNLRNLKNLGHNKTTRILHKQQMHQLAIKQQHDNHQVFPSQLQQPKVVAHRTTIDLRSATGQRPANDHGNGNSNSSSSMAFATNSPQPGGLTTISASRGPIWTSQLQQPSFIGDLNVSISPVFQWTILIGSLLSLVLLVLIILRKLLTSSLPVSSSYQWMLAKQTLKSSCGASGSSSLDQTSGVNECHCPLHHSLGGCSSSSTRQPPPHLLFGSNLTQEPLVAAGNSSYKRQHHLVRQQQQQQHHPVRCNLSSWRHRQDPSDESSQSNSNRKQQQLIVDSNGRHLLVTGNSAALRQQPGDQQQFNTDVQFCNQPLQFGSWQRRDRREVELNRNGQSVLSLNDYNYDTLNNNGSDYYAQAAVEQVDINQRADCKSSFVLARDLVVDLSQSGSQQKQLDNQEPQPQLINKRMSPNVPTNQKSQPTTSSVISAAATASEPNSNFNPNLGVSRSSSVSVASSSGSSIQSTTAQLLTSSFSSNEQPALEVANEYAAPLASNIPVANDVAVSSTSAGNSPGGLKTSDDLKRPKRMKSLAGGGGNQVIQSQPNSPMFANQFARSTRQQNNRPQIINSPFRPQRNGSTTSSPSTNPLSLRHSDLNHVQGPGEQDRDRHHYEEIATIRQVRELPRGKS